MTTAPSNSSPKLGSDADPIRQGLFASQSMNELLQHVKLDGEPGPFQTLADAARLVDAGMKKEAISVLNGILSLPKVETRIQLWVWSALRGLGVMPESKAAWEILGVVVEVPMQGAYDTLAAYQDGSARYLNFSGKAIFWDKPDEVIGTLCRTLFQSAVSAGSQAKPRLSFALPKSGIQLTLLTRSGSYAISNPPESSVRAAAALMNELIKHAKVAKNEQAQRPE
jgi:hypothetical protein